MLTRTGVTAMTDRNPTQREGNERNQSDAPPPDLDPAGGISRDELDTRRSGAPPVEQNDRTRDRELDPAKLDEERDSSSR
jgi:hypothetical protein